MPLFFDEADSIFGKRTEVKDARDRYANQETSYLLQRIEKCKGLVILASNYRQNLDAAFTRRILSFIKIDAPEEPERIRLWREGLPESYNYAPQDLPEKLAKAYSLTGANIANIIKQGCFASDDDAITFEILESFIKAEYDKEEGRSYLQPHAWPMTMY